MAGCGAKEIAALLSDIVEPALGAMGFDIDDVSGAIDDSATVTSSTVTGGAKRISEYKSKEELTEAVQKKKEAINRAFKMMKYAEEVDLCFLVDCTGSMEPYIARVKSNIKQWYERLRANYKHLTLRVAFVRYTDFDQPKSTRTTWLDFTENVGTFLSFVDSIKTPPGVGGDSAEDVFGGLEAVVTELSWRKIGTKVMIHFADAPCHGTQYHSDSVDDYHKDGDPDKRDLNEIMAKLYRREIYYHFGYINKAATSKMIKEFDKVLLERGGNEMCINTFNAEDPPLMDEAVYRSISTSISASLQKLSAAAGKPKSKIRKFELTDALPEWGEVAEHKVTISKPKPAATGTSVDLPSIPKGIKKAPKPFAKGAMRLAYHAFIPDERKHVVMKEFLADDTDEGSLKRYMLTVNILAKAASFASEFNKDRPAGLGVSLEFATCGLIQTPVGLDGKQRYYSYEPFIDGSYTKFNSNNGYVAPGTDPVNETCQAFSHYTWIRSDKRLIVCDIQGVKRSDKVILTDPAIHDKNVLLYGETNLGAKGIRRFFESHYCSEICIRMGLDKSPHQPPPK